MDGIKAHVGNCTVYLVGWENVDLFDSGSALAKDCPGGVAKWGTTEDDYYGKLKHIDAALLGAGTPDHETIVCDRYGSWSNLPFDDDSVAILLSRQVFEHLSKTEAKCALAEARRVMKVGGVLRLDVPDHEATIQEYARLACKCEMSKEVSERIELKRKAAFMLRHLLGSRKNDFAYHMGSWTKPRLIEFCKQYGFQFVAEEPNIHFYPAFCLRFEKLPTCGIPELDDPLHPWLAAHQYCGQPRGELEVPKDWKVLEVGPGTAPWSRSNAFCDVVPRDLPNFTLGDVQKLPYRDREFDYIFVSHVLEHVCEPKLAIAELNRVAHSGCIVSPTPFKEGVMFDHEQDHRWWVMAGAEKLYFYRIPKQFHERVYDSQISGEMHRIWRYGERRLEGLANRCKQHFHNIEPVIDAVFHFSPERPLKAEVLE